MTDQSQQLNSDERRRLAEFMGWVYHSEFMGKECDGFYTSGLTLICTEGNWHPDTDWAQCGMLFDEFTQRLLRDNPATYLGVNTALRKDGSQVWWIGGPLEIAWRCLAFPTARLAICRAALAWMDAQEAAR